MVKKLYWKAHSGKDRNEIIDFVKTSISNHEAYILNFDTFSDLALSLQVGIEENSIKSLHEALSKSLNISKLETIEFSPGSKKEWILLVNVSFTKGTGKTTKTIPDVPG